jgi:hypothetical protein
MKHEQGEGGRGHQCARVCIKREARDPKFFTRMDGPASERVRAEQERVKAWHAIHGVEHDRSGCRG